MQLTHLLLLAGALGASAHPSRHAHLHRSMAKRDAEYVKNVHKEPPPPPPTSSKAPAPSPSPPPAQKVSVQPEEEKVDTNTFIPFCGGTSSKEKRVTYDQIMYAGNSGTSGGCKWNSNIMLVPNAIADKYDYVQEYTNVADEPYQVICANKMGANGLLTGLCDIPGQEQLKFNLAPGETKTVVADANTQGACAFAPKEVPLTKDNWFAGTWAEFDFGSSPNKGWSGADCSALVAMNATMDVYGCRMSHNGVHSTIFPGGQADNAYIKGMEAEDGVGLNIPPGSTNIKVQVGYS